ncbi:MAG: 1,4-alpha-glucan branching protein GlgB [Anaerolineae bacterium]|nr:1,4-alpha-glucan branching protein GlgB [Anaerolineae bacterium]
MKTTLSADQMNRIVQMRHHDPFDVLGAHVVEWEGEQVVTVRAMVPHADTLTVVAAGGDEYPMSRVHVDGIYEAVCAGRSEVFGYRLRATNVEGHSWEIVDPYSFLPVLSDFDLQLLGEGNHFKSYDRLGAHAIEIGGVRGTLFAVWAPNAQAVSVVGNFSAWDERRYSMRVRGGSGVWELFIPGIGPGEVYKFKIRGSHGKLLEKADPYAFYAEMRPRTGSVIWDIEGYRWDDAVWMEQRAQTNLLYKPVSIYEVHLGSWMRAPEEGERFLTYRELTPKLVDYVLEMGYTHIELLPVMEHPFDGSWGYQVTGYFAPTSRFGTPQDFMYFVDCCHQHGIGVILDWVPAHFPRDAHSLARFDGTALYEYDDPRKGEHKDWGTLIFNFGRNEVRNFLIASGLFWLDKYHVDGLRVDAVASMLYLDYSRQPGEWEPNVYGGNENLEAISFIRRFNELCYQYFPGVITVAEESTSFSGVSKPTYLGGLGFGFKWNMGWMNDTLRYIQKNPVYRKYHHNDLTFGLVYAFTENFVQVISHDEVVHGKGSMLGKMPGDDWQKLANLRAYYGFMYTHPGKKLLFMGGEFGQWREWSEERSLDWHLLQWEPHQKLQRFVADLNRLYRSEPALHERDFSPAGFEWIDLHDWEHSIISYIRRAAHPGDHLVVLCNLTPTPREGYRIGVPEHCLYQEVLNSDAAIYGGSNMGNQGGFWSEELPWQGRPYSLNLTVPPLSICVFKPQR